MKRLPAQAPEIIWNWGVCDTYRNPRYLRQVVGSRARLDARDVLKLPIRPVDKLWVLLRPEMLPDIVLDRACDRIAAVLPARPDELPGPTLRERARLVPACRKSADYWGVSRHTSTVVERTGLRALADEHERQLTILREEIDKWLNEK